MCLEENVGMRLDACFTSVESSEAVELIVEVVAKMDFESALS